MRRVSWRFRSIFFAMTFSGMMSVSLFAQGIFAVEQWPAPPTQSQAYKQFTSRPYSELSKIIYLIDRFGDAGIEILYDGHYYQARFAKQVARWFLFHRYKKETAEQWIQVWCHKSVFSGNLIWVKLADKSMHPAREVLLEELKALDTDFKEQQNQKKPPVELIQKEAIAEAAVTQVAAANVAASAASGQAPQSNYLLPTAAAASSEKE